MDFGHQLPQFLTLYAVKVMGAGPSVLRRMAGYDGVGGEPVVRALAVDGLASIGPSEAGGHRRSVQLTARGRDWSSPLGHISKAGWRRCWPRRMSAMGTTRR